MSLEILQHPAAVPHKMPDRLLTLAGEAETFMTPGGDAYAVVEGRTLTWDDFEGWLVRRYREEYGEMALREVIGTALYNLKMEAKRRPRREVYTRVASHDGKLYLDLCDEENRVVEVDADGWRIREDCPVPFRRAAGMLPLPEPTHGGDVGALRTLLHLASDEDWVLVVAWLLGALHPTGPHPILALHGERGSGKSWITRTLRSLMDPNVAPARSLPSSGRDLAIAAKNSYALCFDNLSSLHQKMSDDLCTLSYGSGFATRKLNTDDTESIFQAHRPIIINGIVELATSGDLLDRSLILTLAAFEERDRKPEAEMREQLEAARPGIVGALLDLVSAALRAGPTGRGGARMRDFEDWVLRVEDQLGWEPGHFSRVYAANRERARAVELDAVPVATALLARIDSGDYDGERFTMGELLRDLEHWEDVAGREYWRVPNWPKNGQALHHQIARMAPALRARGVKWVEAAETNKGRTYGFQRTESSHSSQSSQSSRK